MLSMSSQFSPWQPRPSLRKTSVAKSNPVFPKKKDSTEDEGPKRPTERRKPTRRRLVNVCLRFGAGALCFQMCKCLFDVHNMGH